MSGLDDTAAYFDDPEHPERAQDMCRILMLSHPEWTVTREPGRWVARRAVDDQDATSFLENDNAGLLNEALFRLRGQEGQA